MLIFGAGGFAKQLIEAIDHKAYERVALFDDINLEKHKFLDKFPVLHSLSEAKDHFSKFGPGFTLGTGNPKYRKLLAEKGQSIGGRLTSVISEKAHISKFCKRLGTGLSVLHGAVIEGNTTIGEGTLINLNVSITHDCTVGKYCELGPGVTLAGNVTLGDRCFLGAGAIVLPDVKLGNDVTIGAGSVVTKNFPDGVTLVGIPGQILRQS